MAMRVLTITSPPTRAQFWKMLAEAVGYFTGSIDTADLSATARIKEGQVRFYPGGHDHNLTTDAGGKPPVSTSIRKRNFDLNHFLPLWGNYYQDEVSPDSGLYIILAGAGSITLTSSATTSFNGVTSTWYYDTVLMDYNPYDTSWDTSTQPCQLDIRTLDVYDSASPFNTNWTLFGAIACPFLAAGGGFAEMYIERIGFGTTGAPHFHFVARTTQSGTVEFDYKVVLKRL